MNITAAPSSNKLMKFNFWESESSMSDGEKKPEMCKCLIYRCDTSFYLFSEQAVFFLLWYFFASVKGSISAWALTTFFFVLLRTLKQFCLRQIHILFFSFSIFPCFFSVFFVFCAKLDIVLCMDGFLRCRNSFKLVILTMHPPAYWMAIIAWWRFDSSSFIVRKIDPIEWVI